MRITAIAAVMLALTPFVGAEENPHTRGSFDSGGVTISYVEAGGGDPVVLVHGLYSSAELNWIKPGTFDLLAKNHHVIAIDLRGHGMSDKPTSEDAYGKPMAEDVVRLMEHLKIQKAQIVGYSLGGIVVMRLLADHPDRFTAAALGGMGWLRQGSVLQGSFEKMGGRNTGHTPAAAVHGISKLALSEKELQSIKTPLEILVGDHDPCKRMYVDPLVMVRKDVSVIEIQDAGHITCIVKEQFKNELAKWVDQNAK
ncbi:MAG TPA: alpha/beta hydrolase [Tepidisphaeraceae bacterium]|jgi:pimeloyl-ACP methyl ester carboxylesterase|nr:alpha/beta hydrolase [Tepidisphaeraceae bacterium]